jgi:hypothetical protein
MLAKEEGEAYAEGEEGGDYWEHGGRGENGRQSG